MSQVCRAQNNADTNTLNATQWERIRELIHNMKIPMSKTTKQKFFLFVQQRFFLKTKEDMSNMVGEYMRDFINKSFSTFLVIQDILYDILKLSENLMRENYLKRIKMEHIYEVIIMDEDLKKLFIC